MKDRYSHHQTWSRGARKVAACVEVVRSDAVDDGDRGPYRWCVYVYLYAGHPRFDWAVENMKILNAGDIPLHGGCTFHHVSFDAEGKPAYVKIGADYNHRYDRAFTYDEDGDRVFADAERLMEWCKTATATPQPTED